jgi:hypothetical protein
MVKHHILIGLGFKKQNFRNRGVQQMLRRASPMVTKFMGGAAPAMTTQPYSRSLPQMGSAIVARRPLKFNY